MRWSASTSLFDLVILFKCTDSLGDEVRPMQSLFSLRPVGTTGVVFAVV